MSENKKTSAAKYQLAISKKGLSATATTTNIPAPSVEKPQTANKFQQVTIEAKDWQLGAEKIENFIGYCHIPVGRLSNLKVKGNYTNGVYDLPLATTEGALVASFQRGAKAANLAGGINAICISAGVQRAPLFILNNVQDAIQLQQWINSQRDTFQKLTKTQSRYAKLNRIQYQLESKRLITIFEFETGDAAGQNMVTFCTDVICKYILENSPVAVRQFYIESNYAGDKKPNHRSLQGVRGKKVIAEVTIPESLVAAVFKSSSEAMVDYFWNQTVASSMAGANGIQGHYANGLTALFLATGQDVACVGEAANGISRIEKSPEGIYASVTLPNLICGTVGGGTNLATAQAGLQMMDCIGKNSAYRYAELAAALVLCGELSITAAIAQGHFVRAHRILGR